MLARHKSTVEREAYLALWQTWSHPSNNPATHSVASHLFGDQAMVYTRSDHVDCSHLCLPWQVYNATLNSAHPTQGDLLPVFPIWRQSKTVLPWSRSTLRNINPVKSECSSSRIWDAEAWEVAFSRAARIVFWDVSFSNAAFVFCSSTCRDLTTN